MVETSRAPATPAGATLIAPVTYVDWPAIFGGAVVGSAIAFVLGAFGSALGLSLVSPYRGEGLPAWGLVVGIGLWVIWVAGTSFLAAGYITGRLRKRLHDATAHEVQVRDGAHGIIAWAVCALIGAVLLAAGTYGTGSIAARGASAAADAVPALSARGAQDARTGRPEETYTVAVDKMFGAGEESTKPGAEAARRVAARIMIASVAAGKMADADRAHLAKLVAARSGIDEGAAQGRVDQAFKDSQALAERAKKAADVARKVGVVSAFMVAASLLIGLAAAWWAATIGGRHRDENTIFTWLQWR